MEKEPYILAVDLGTSALKSALISISGKVAGWEVQEIPLQILPDGGAEQNPLDWWEALLPPPNDLLRKNLCRLKTLLPCVAPRKVNVLCL